MVADGDAAALSRSLEDVLRDPSTAWGDVRAALRRRSVDAGARAATHVGLLLALQADGGGLCGYDGDGLCDPDRCGTMPTGEHARTS